ncbi:MAG: pimeloyl-ACP methyl ester carboxylesterase [Paraglaciecola sp.]|jgi:pimeloyl-ACP methyl ester carboxylesterase
MPRPPPFVNKEHANKAHSTTTQRSQDILGAGRLTVDATTGIIDIVESLHNSIHRVGGLLGDANQTRTSGMTGVVYGTIRKITGLIGSGIDSQLQQPTIPVQNADSSEQREALLSVINGIMGDQLVAKNNPLAIPMQLRAKGKVLDKQSLQKLIRDSNGQIALMIHGLCMNDLQWQRQGHDHGEALARELGFTPIYLHYNSGRHIYQNAQDLSALLDSLLTQASKPIELSIIAHSMGGLVSRSAYHYATKDNLSWPAHLKKLVCLGSPHHGAPMEKGGNWIDTLLKISPYSAPFTGLTQVRSSGITDLRYGHLLEEDRQGKDRFERLPDQRTPLPLPDDVQCYAVAASIQDDAKAFGEELIGDGLVTVSSALGRHKQEALRLDFKATHQWIGRNINHMELLSHPEVYKVIKAWLA